MATPATSGKKYVTAHGFSAIKNGVKRTRLVPTVDANLHTRKPDWLRVRISPDPRFREVKEIVTTHQLATVCEESHCPNIGECWSQGTATIMLMGAVCTRACRFCAVDTGNPRGWLDEEEPANAARAVSLMGLKYVVLTSVDRDDLPLGGAAHYAACIRAIRAKNLATKIEALTPDFGGELKAVESTVIPELDVFAHNLETVRRLTPIVRDPRATYDQSLAVLRHAKIVRTIATKSSLMLGLGETDDEIRQAFFDLREVGVDFLTLGQYLQPTLNHLPVVRWVYPDEFTKYRDWGLHEGFVEVHAGPLVRSSYRAERLFEKALN